MAYWGGRGHGGDVDVAFLFSNPSFASKKKIDKITRHEPHPFRPNDALHETGNLPNTTRATGIRQRAFFQPRPADALFTARKHYPRSPININFNAEQKKKREAPHKRNSQIGRCALTLPPPPVPHYGFTSAKFRPCHILFYGGAADDVPLGSDRARP